MANSWFRMYSEFATDPKVQMLSEVDQRRLTMLFCLRCNDNVTLRDEEVTFLLRISNESWQVTKSLFIAKGFIDENNEVLNWDKRQFISDSSAERVARHRAKNNIDVTIGNVTVTPPEQIQNRTDTEQKEQIVAKAPKYIPPISEDLFKEYSQIRKSKKAGPFTERMFDAICREATKAGITAEQAITICCEKSWVGFDANWLQKTTGNSSRDQGRSIAALSIFKPEHTQHLQGNQAGVVNVLLK